MGEINLQKLYSHSPKQSFSQIEPVEIRPEKEEENPKKAACFDRFLACPCFRKKLNIKIHIEEPLPPEQPIITIEELTPAKNNPQSEKLSKSVDLPNHLNFSPMKKHKTEIVSEMCEPEPNSLKKAMKTVFIPKKN